MELHSQLIFTWLLSFACIEATREHHLLKRSGIEIQQSRRRRQTESHLDSTGGTGCDAVIVILNGYTSPEEMTVELPRNKSLRLKYGEFKKRRVRVNAGELFVVKVGNGKLLKLDETSRGATSSGFVYFLSLNCFERNELPRFSWSDILKRRWLHLAESEYPCQEVELTPHLLAVICQVLRLLYILSE